MAAMAPIASRQRVAAGEDDLPDLRPAVDVSQRAGDVLGRQHPALRGADRLAPEAEAAIDRAGGDEFQKHPVGITVDEPFAGRVGVVADRVGEVARIGVEFAQVGHELAGDRVGGVSGIDQVRESAG